jgi:hypothetical protein
MDFRGDHVSDGLGDIATDAEDKQRVLVSAQ